MKKIFFLTILILILSPFAVSAHQQSKDYFDFETYVGNDETLQVVPKGGSYGNWGVNNPLNSSTLLRDGVTSAKTDKGTSMVLVRKNAQYPGIYYSFKNNYTIADSLHVSFAIKISGTIEDGSVIFRFRKPNNSTPYNVMTFSDSGYVTFFGKVFRKDGITPRYEKDKWYYVDVIYDVTSGYTKINLNDGEDFNIDYEGMSGYEEALTPVQLVMVETTGYIKGGYEGRIYLDDWLVESIPKVYVENRVQTFSDFDFSPDGTKVSDEYMLTSFVANQSDTKTFAGVFKDELDGTEALALSMNTDTPLSLWGNFKYKINNAGTFETDLRLCNSIADTVLYLGNTACYEEALRIKAQTGSVSLFGQCTQISLSPFKDYHISLSFDLLSGCGFAKISDGENIWQASFTLPLPRVEEVSAYKLCFENYMPHGQTAMKTIVDNISLYGRDSIYISHCDMNEPAEGVLLNSQNNRTKTLYVPSNSGSSYHFGYTLNPGFESGRIKLMLSGESDESFLELDLSTLTAKSGDGEGIVIDKTIPVDLNAQITKTSVKVSAVQKGVVLLEKDIALSDNKNIFGSYLEYETDSSDEVKVTKHFGSAKYDFDISEAFVSGSGEYTVKLNNPIDTKASVTAKVNRSVAVYEIADAYTLKIFHSTDCDANITLNIKDIFGNAKTLTAEVAKTDVKDGYIISNPVFLAEKSGIYTSITQTRPGSINAIINIEHISNKEEQQ